MQQHTVHAGLAYAAHKWRCSSNAAAARAAATAWNDEALPSLQLRARCWCSTVFGQQMQQHAPVNVTVQQMQQRRTGKHL
jgi:hypothetical protein